MSETGLFLKSVKAVKTAATPNARANVAASTKPKDVQKRWLYVAAGLVGVVVLSTSVLGDKKAVQGPAVKPISSMVNTNPPNADKDAFTSKFAKDLEAVKVEQGRLARENEQKDKRIQELMSRPAGSVLSEIPPGGIVAPPIKPSANNGGLGSIVNLPPAPPDAPSRLTVPPSIRVGQPNALPDMPTQALPVNNEPMVFPAPAVEGKATDATAIAAGGVEARSSYKKNANAGLIPAGAFAPISLLNGVDAGTATSTQSNPMPVLMRITDQATLPGSAKYRLKSCFVLATAYGDLSAERVYARISRLSCVDKADRLILSQEVQGYLVDSDGKLGLRGMVTDRQGAKVGKALLAGFAQGLAGALGSAQSSVSTNSLTGGTTSTIGGVDAVRAAGLSGAQSATSQLAAFYLKEAQSIFPVITVDAGRTGTIVFSASTPLTWSDSDSQFTQSVTPGK